MTVRSPLRHATTDQLRALARDLTSGRLTLPLSAARLSSNGHGTLASDADALAVLLRWAAAMQAPALAEVLEAVAGEREAHAVSAPELVWSGPENGLRQSRDTAVVLRGMFAAAQRRVLVAGFVVYEGRVIFETLAEKMDADPRLEVRLYLNVARAWGDARSSDAEVLRAFAEDFRTKQWPGSRLPEVFYDPRALSTAHGPRAVLHAKCVVVDETQALVTSANFTEAAQERNIEAGVLLHDAALARALRGQFEALVTTGELLRVPGLG